NASDTYSYPQVATNHATDWSFESISSGNGNGQGMDSWISSTKAGGAQPCIPVYHVHLAWELGAGPSDPGPLPTSVYSAPQPTDPSNSAWGNGFRTSGQNITGNAPSLAYEANSPSIERACIQPLTSTFGDSQHGGAKYSTMGNEP